MIFETAWSMIKYDEIHQHMMGHHWSNHLNSNPNQNTGTRK
jgi:hypothetical protein